MTTALCAFPDLHHLDLYIWLTNEHMSLPTGSRPKILGIFQGKKTGCSLKRVIITKVLPRYPGKFSDLSTACMDEFLAFDVYYTGTKIDIHGLEYGERWRSLVESTKDGWAPPLLP